MKKVLTIVLSLLILSLVNSCKDEEKLVLFPAWPKEWDVQFKLSAPQNTVIEGEFKGGELIDLRVTPKNRKKDLEIMDLN